MSPQVIGFLLMICAALFGGSVPSVSKIVLQVFSPTQAFFMRVVVASILFAIFISVSKHRYSLKTFKSQWKVSLLMVVNSGCAIFALNYIPSALVPIIYATIPLMTLIMLKYRDRSHTLSVYQLVGIITGFLGVLIATYGSLHTIAMAAHAWIGVGMILLGAFCFSLYSILSKSMQQSSTPIHITFTMTLVATIIMLPLGIIDFMQHDYFVYVQPKHVVALLATGVIGTVAFYICYQYAIKKTSPQVASLFTYIQPVFAVGLSILLIGEQITPIFITGSVLAIAGASLASKK